MAGEQPQSGRDEFLSSADGVGESPTGDCSGALDADVVAALRHLAEMINQGPEFGAVSPLAGLRRGARRKRVWSFGGHG
jgi:hypothetical protein